jgi:hypothetical protein
MLKHRIIKIQIETDRKGSYHDENCGKDCNLEECPFDSDWDFIRKVEFESLKSIDNIVNEVLGDKEAM